ncbi:MAG: hypothetical protein GOV01_01620 [Candidatus Altiarchaeota archaeon]|nr:hypothetical protein [Candidatus Altiarchaeota archaeon]
MIDYNKLTFGGLIAVPFLIGQYSKLKIENEQQRHLDSGASKITEHIRLSDEDSQNLMIGVAENCTNIADIILMQDGVFDTLDSVSVPTYGRIIPYNQFNTSLVEIEPKVIEEFTFSKNDQVYLHLDGFLQEHYMGIISSKTESWFSDNASDFIVKWGINLLGVSIPFRRTGSKTSYSDAAKLLTLYGEGVEMKEIFNNYLSAPASVENGVRGI